MTVRSKTRPGSHRCEFWDQGCHLGQGEGGRDTLLRRLSEPRLREALGWPGFSSASRCGVDKVQAKAPRTARCFL